MARQHTGRRGTEGGPGTMTLFLVALVGLFGLLSSFLTIMYLVGLARISQLKQQLEEEQAWSDEYARQLKEARREYATVLRLHDNAIIPTLSQAWQQVVKK